MPNFNQDAILAKCHGNFATVPLSDIYVEAVSIKHSILLLKLHFPSHVLKMHVGK